MTYSLDFRRHVMRYREKHHLSLAQTAHRFPIGVATVKRWSVHPMPRLTKSRHSIKIDMDALRQDVIDYKDAYLREQAKRFGVSISGISYALRRLGVSYKKT